MTSQEIRQKFLTFFQEKQHHIVPSAPMVIKNDPTLMFTNAGMNQFKDIFLGNSPVKYPRVADTQKCLRVSGKHNDLDVVGHDTYHHTMFEMLGNWSFGNYFKKEAIEWAWELLTDRLGIDKNRLYITVFGGDEKDGMERDNEAFNFWKNIISEDRILFGSKKDNFWEMGDMGPCGPCSEIHADIRTDEERKQKPGHELVNQDHPQVIEIWNLVFIQYNRLANGTLEQLPAKHVDTGMGFERLCMVLQGKQSNYDTDVFQPLIQALAKKSNKTYGNDEKADIAMRVCADHLRAVSFAIADGQLPSNAKAGYVIRRILRRAVRYGYTFLDFKEPFLNEILCVLVQQMGMQFPELKAQEELIRRVILEEEQAFLRTLSNGIIKFENYVKGISSNKIIDGNFAFELFDTYGFPIDLTQLMAKEKGLDVDMDGFAKGLEEQKNRSRQAAAVDTEDWIEIKQGEQTLFQGYDMLSCEVEILRYRKVKTKDKEFYQLVFDKTPFYAESGGQVGDKGYIEANGERIEIINTKKENNLSVHHTQKLPSDLTATFTAQVDVEKRKQTEANHTATHLLHKALREVLGTHVEQKGSLVEDNRLRFDFSHFSKLTDEEIRAVERNVNEKIRSNIKLEDFRQIPIDEANKMGAMALFGEKYGETVRVVKYNDSIELCGGTHVNATGNIGIFKIVAESAIAAGIRRIEAITGKQVEENIYFFQDTLKNIQQLLNNQQDFSGAIRKMIDDNSQLKDQIIEFQNEQAKNLKTRFIENAEVINGIHVISSLLPLNPEVIKTAYTMLKPDLDKFIIIVGSNFNDKPTLMIALSDNLVKEGKNASTVVREAAKEIQGGGGGQPAFATAGGKNTDGLVKAMEKAKELLIG